MQTPADMSKFLQDSPEPCITSLASIAVKGTQVPVRIYPEICTVTVTVQKNKLYRILGEGRQGEEGKVKEEFFPASKPHEEKQFNFAVSCSS
jgi:hypothetical protein